jgi:putative inorganic carbon (HCO3(-)) transporter
MRDILVTLMVFATLPYILRNPWYGVLAWSWLSYMNPHRLAWGFAYDFPFAQIVAITLLISLLINKQEKSLPKNRIVVFWALFLLWMSISTAMAIYPDLAFENLQNVLKIQIITFVTMLLMKDFQRVNQLIWVIIFSIGFYSVKGGVFTVLTGGGFTVHGPDGCEIAENNAFGVAVLMTIPLMVYVYKFPPKNWVQKIMPFCIGASAFAVLGTQSRGAFIAIFAVTVFFWWKSRNKLISGLVILLVGVIAFVFMPESYHDRMASTTNYEQDASAQGRINAWMYSIAAANDRITGGGFSSYSVSTYQDYMPEASQVLVAHSIYFSVLADHGWPGLFLFLSILIMMWRQFSKVISATQGNPELAAHHFLARMMQVSMVAYMSGGAFLSLAYFDYAWHIMAIAIAMTQLTFGLSPEVSMGKRGRTRQRAAGYGRGRRVAGKP